MSIVETLINEYSQNNLSRFFRQVTQVGGNYRDLNEDVNLFDPKHFTKGKLIGDLAYENGKLAVVAYSSEGELTEKSSRKAQFEEAKNFLKQKQSYSLGGIFVFSDDYGNFRFSFIYWRYSGKKRIPNSYTRSTYYVSKTLSNKTFITQLSDAKWENYTSLLTQTFSIQAITKAFYSEFYAQYKTLADSIKSANNISQKQAEDFTLLFVIRLIFIGFVQKRHWLGDNTDFIRHLWHIYQKQCTGNELFYSEWLSPLFFKALSSARDHRQFSFTHLPAEIINHYQNAPYLNGGLFRTNLAVDSTVTQVPDQPIGDFIEYLFNYNFTIEENSYNDADLELNPEFLGIIFERLVNKADGAVYTPRVEVDLMCKLALSNWLVKNTTVPISQLYQLFFREDEEVIQTRGQLSQTQKDEVLLKLKSITICDPAVGSGAFPVGMISILAETLQYLYTSPNRKPDSDYNIKKGIIEKSLYGVEVKEWAVWITQLRLWIALFVDAPDNLRDLNEPILPSLDFKIRRGDSLVQLLGSRLMSIKFDQHDISTPTLDKLKQIAQAKSDYFFNKSSAHDPHSIRLAQITILREYLESEEHRLKSDLTRAKTPSIGYNQQSLLIDEPKQTEISFSASSEEIAAIEQSIKQVQIQLRDIRNIADQKYAEIPFIWGLEFSEIFYGPKQGFDLVIGNPPYVRQEDISDPEEKIEDKKEYKNLLAEMVKHDFPMQFPPKSKVNAQSDLYTYFYIRGLRLLNENGIETYICSNSWLDVGYGVWLQKFLLDVSPVEMIVDNHAKRSFGEADVNTIISVIHAPQTMVNPDHLTRFIAFKKPFEEVVNSNNLIDLTNTTKILSTEDFRVYPITTTALIKAGTEYAEDDHMAIGTYNGDKWGTKYLRCSDLVFNLIYTNLRNFGTTIRKIADVESGIYSGINEFFYLAHEKIRNLKLPSNYLIPLVKSPQHVKGLLLNSDSIKFSVFTCFQTKNELLNNNQKNVLEYIEWGEKQVTKEKGKVKAGIPWPQVETVKNRKPEWYSLKVQKSTNQFMFYGYNDRFIQPFSLNKQYLADRRLHFVYAQKGVDTLALGTILNSTLTTLFIELQGRVGMGGGALDYATMDAKKTIILNPKYIKVSSNLSILNRATIYDIFTECGIDPRSEVSIEEQEPKPLPDRAELDNIVFDALDLSADERKEVYRAVCRLVWNRISKAKSV